MADRPYMCRDEGLFLPECDDCSQLEGRVKALEDCCETATEELADHEERISSAENTLTNHTQTLSEQNTRITANSNSISANTQSIGQAESEINSVKSRVTTAESDIDTLQEDLMSAQSDIQSNTDAIDSIERLPEVTSADDGKVLTVVGGRWGIMPSSLVGEAIVGQSTVGQQGSGGSGLEHLLDGSQNGSLRSNTSAEEDANYTMGTGAVALGTNTIASGVESFAEGRRTEATGERSHAEGNITTASGHGSHAEGFNTEATADASHAEGKYTRAAGEGSHAQNTGTIASSDSQTALGKYNIEDDLDTYAVIVGNGQDENNRQNAFTVDWQGRIECGDYSGAIQSIFDIIYPIGSYYETSDSTFDPNTAWGGTWVKVAGGLIKGEPLITRKQERKTTDTTVSNSSGINLLTVQHTSNTGKVWIYGAATVKTNANTSAINIDANGQTDIGQSVTNNNTYTRLTVMTQRSGMPIGTPFTVALRMTAQDTSTTATCAAYTTSQLFVSDVPLKMGYCWHRTA